ncbi:hypothetical protein R3P38DRAFT_490028 [Favolaschia claudopus]|uniref:Uncharacterized protein n=1 Tax=Favolaschia claudopus TaxID=2862362 RepID=A0AAW0CMK2_9AGAR
MKDFDWQAELIRVQRESTELTAYARCVEMVVTMSWPTHNGVKIRPDGIKNYLRARGLFIECACAFESDAQHPRSCQIVVSSLSGNVFAFCHFDRARCQFRLALSKIHDTSVLTSSYRGLPTIRSGAKPDIDLIATAFTLKSHPPQHLAPHIEGYFGEHVTDYPAGTHQLSGSLLPHLPSKRHIASNVQPRNYQRKASPPSNRRYLEIDDYYPDRTRQTVSAPAATLRSAAIAGPSRIPMDSISAPVPMRTLGRDEKYLKNLSLGQGISEEAWAGIGLEKCSKCKLLFVSSALKSHIKICLGAVIIL